MTNSFVELLRESTRDHLRLIDRYLISDQYEHPLDLYTFDGRFTINQHIIYQDDEFTVIRDETEYKLENIDQLINY